MKSERKYGGFLGRPGLVTALSASLLALALTLVPVEVDATHPTSNIAEPTTNRATDESALRSTSPLCTSDLCGYADLHVHMFGHLAHGGGVLAGYPYKPPSEGSLTSDVNQALHNCSYADLLLVDKKGVVEGKNVDGLALLHGTHDLVGDPIGEGTRDPAFSGEGVPGFGAWPWWDSTTHQQVYHTWLERAWQGGMRLMVMLAVTNEALCKGSKRLAETNCEDSMASIDKQLSEAKKFEKWIDDRMGGSSMGWFRIVKTPQEARQAISEDKLAVVLGIEVDNLFNCKFGSQNCDESFVRRELQKYYDNGVRHIFPIHNFNNAYGGPALFLSSINAGNFVSENHFFGAEECADEGYGFKLDATEAHLLLSLGFGMLNIPYEYTQTATCNKRGLSSLGGFLIQEMMSKKMIIDIDHMSNHSLDATMVLAEAAELFGGPKYPLVASHVLFSDLVKPERRHERMRTAAQLQRLASLGSVIAPMLKDDHQDDSNADPGAKYTLPYGGPRDNCRRSSVTWAQSYVYAVDQMTDRTIPSPPIPGIAVGSDFNGIAGHVGPRFGPDGCGGNSSEVQNQEENRLTYPFSIPGFATFDKQVTGQRIFDFNTDGLAHIGLLPDLIADIIQNNSIPVGRFRPLFRSAEAYVEMWEQIERTKVPAKSLGTVVAKCKNLILEAQESTRVLNGLSACGAYDSIDNGSGVQDASGNIDTTKVFLTQEPNVQFGVYPLGSNPVSLRVTDNTTIGSANEGECEAIVEVVDTSGPPFTKCPNEIQAECINGKGSVFDFTTDSLRFAIGEDTCAQKTDPPTPGHFLGCVDGAGNSVISADHQLASIEMDLGSSLPLTCKAGDGSGNVSSCPVNVKVADLSPPHFAIVNLGGTDGCSTGEFVECEGREIDGQWVQGGTFTKSFTATDRCDGPITATCQKQGGESGDTFYDRPARDANNQPVVDSLAGTVKCTAMDRAGLSKTCTTPVTVRDTQNAQITCPAEPVTMQCTGSGGAQVALATIQDPVTAFDACRGPLPDSSIRCKSGGGFLNPNTPTTFPLGETSVICEANDLYDAQFAHTHSWVSCPLTVKVEDTEKPTFTTSCPNNITTTATGRDGANVSWSAVEASDSCSGVNVTCDHAPGDTFPVGNTQVACAATDTSENINTCNFNVQVSYPFTGFAQPVDAAPTFNTVSGGAGVPVRFGLGGDFGLNIFAAGYPKSQKITCDSTAPIDDIESTVTVGNSSLSYSGGANQYTYAWKTDKAWGGTCRQLTMRLADGTDKVAYFKFK